MGNLTKHISLGYECGNTRVF